MTNLLLAANRASSTLAGSITNTATSANLASGSGVEFPAPTSGQYFTASFVDAATGLVTEIVWVTNVTGDTVTMIRAQEGTEALPWSAGDTFANLMTAGQLELMVQPLTAQQSPWSIGVDTGSANVCAVTLAPVPNSYASLQGALFGIQKSSAANTGAVTLNFNGLGALSITHADGTALAASELPASGWFEVRCNTTSFQLQSVGSAGSVSPAALQIQAGNFAIDSGTANAIAITLSQVPASYASIKGSSFRIQKSAAANTGNVTVNFNTLGALALVHADGSQMEVGELPASGMIEVSLNGTNCTLLSAPNAPSAGASAASTNDMKTAGSTTVFASPGTMNSSPFCAKGWINFTWNGSAVVVNDSDGCCAGAAVTRTSQGIYQIPCVGTFGFFGGVAGAWATGPTANLYANAISQLGAGFDPSLEVLIYGPGGGGVLSDPSGACTVWILGNGP